MYSSLMLVMVMVYRIYITYGIDFPRDGGRGALEAEATVEATGTGGYIVGAGVVDERAHGGRRIIAAQHRLQFIYGARLYRWKRLHQKRDGA